MTPKRSFIKKGNVIFKEDLPRLGDEDADSVQHLEASVIDDHNEQHGQSQILAQLREQTEQNLLNIDQYDFKNRNLKPKHLLLRPNRSRILANIGYSNQQQAAMLSQTSINAVSAFRSQPRAKQGLNKTSTSNSFVSPMRGTTKRS